mmetsp:Transcript_15562/g.17340  ORF Transcript_15562/g.17340 Transcript_15562/m.17340 type:complete len:227 (-) Transcript_15562:211-891(-)
MSSSRLWNPSPSSLVNRLFPSTTSPLATSTSTPLESSSLVDPKEMPVLPDVRLSLIPTVDGVPTEVEPSPERIPPRLIVLPPTPVVGWPSRSSRLDSVSVPVCSFRTPLVWPSPFLSLSRPTVPNKVNFRPKPLPILSSSTLTAVLVLLPVTLPFVSPSTTRPLPTAISDVNHSSKTVCVSSPGKKLSIFPSTLPCLPMMLPRNWNPRRMKFSESGSIKYLFSGIV